MGGAVLCGTAGAGAVTSRVTAPARVARRLGHLTALVIGRCDVDQAAGRGVESKEEAAGRNGWISGVRAGLTTAASMEREAS